MLVISCQSCGTEVLATRRTRKFCDGCKAVRHNEVARQSEKRRPPRFRGEIKQKECAACHAAFVTPKDYQRYCPTCKQTAEANGPSGTYYLRTAGAPIPSQATCPTCGEPFAPKAIRQRFCSRPCHSRSLLSRAGEKINNRMRAGTHASLKGTKNGRSWQDLAGYTTQDLKRHIERQFAPGMTWDKMGEWHIDHRLPLASFDFSSPDDPAFRAAWSLTNLQPLWAEDNIRKRAKVTCLL